MEEKNLIFALILSAIFSGVGNVYNGLAKRGLVELIVAVIISLVVFPLGLLWWAYVLYDTYICNVAINNNQQIPKFLFTFDIEE